MPVQKKSGNLLNAPSTYTLPTKIYLTRDGQSYQGCKATFPYIKYIDWGSSNRVLNTQCNYFHVYYLLVYIYNKVWPLEAKNTRIQCIEQNKNKKQNYNIALSTVTWVFYGLCHHKHWKRFFTVLWQLSNIRECKILSLYMCKKYLDFQKCPYYSSFMNTNLQIGSKMKLLRK